MDLDHHIGPLSGRERSKLRLFPPGGALLCKAARNSSFVIGRVIALSS
jgi:hypothetical protein